MITVLTFFVCFFSSSVKKWHPDRWTKDPFRSGEAKRRFQQIQEAYSGKDPFRVFDLRLFCCCIYETDVGVW